MSFVSEALKITGSSASELLMVGVNLMPGVKPKVSTILNLIEYNGISKESTIGLLSRKNFKLKDSS